VEKPKAWVESEYKREERMGRKGEDPGKKYPYLSFIQKPGGLSLV